MSDITDNELQKGIPNDGPSLIDRIKSNTEASAHAITLSVKVLREWGATPEQVMLILRISTSGYVDAISGNLKRMVVEEDHLIRAALVVDMHRLICTVFNNPINQKRFMSLPNHNLDFTSKSPLSFMAKGDISTLHKIHNHLQDLAKDVF